MGSASLEAELGRIPTCLRADVQRAVEELLARGAKELANGLSAEAAKVFAGSEFVARTLLAQPELLRDLATHTGLKWPPSDAELSRSIAAAAMESGDEVALKRILRRLRQREMVQVAWRDLTGQADLDEVMHRLSRLADSCLQAAYDWLYRSLSAKHGAPIGAISGSAVGMVVLALGKL